MKVGLSSAGESVKVGISSAGEHKHGANYS